MKERILKLLSKKAYIRLFVDMDFVYKTLEKRPNEFDVLDAQFIWRCYNTEWWYHYFSKSPGIPE